MAKAKTNKIKTIEDALVPVEEHPYEIPENWCWVYQHVICKLGDGETRQNESFPYLEAKYLRGNSEPKIIESGKFIEAKTKVILVDGENSGEVFEVSEPGYMGSTFKTLEISDGIDEKFLLYFVASNKDLLRNSKTGSAIPHLNKKLFFSMAFPLPPLPEQQRIVEQVESLFFKLDDTKEKVKTVLDTSEDRINAIYHKAFAGELTKNWRKANGISIDSWGKCLSQEVCEPITCGKTPKEYISDEGEIPYLKVYNISNNEIDFVHTPQFIPRSIHEGKLKSSILKKNDVIMNIVGPPLRKIAIIPDDYDEWNMNQAIVRFRPYPEKMNYKFLYYTLLNPETLDDVVNQTRGVVGQANISVSQSRSLSFICPSLDEQMEIVRILENLIKRENEINECCLKVLISIDLQKKSILSKAFRGELGTNSISDESPVELLKRMEEQK